MVDSIFQYGQENSQDLTYSSLERSFWWNRWNSRKHVTFQTEG